jgi:hypothetical protein
MEQITAFVEGNERWFYLSLVFVALWYLRAFWGAQHRLHMGAYILERETAGRERAFALSMLVLLAAASGFVYMTAQHISPNLGVLLSPPIEDEGAVLITAAPTETPDVVLLLPGQPTPSPVGTATLAPQNTPVPAAGVGCDNPLAIIVSPLPGAVLSGKVEVRGTADIPDFAFYVLEISTLGDNWLNILTQSEPVSAGIMGQWDSTRHAPGEHAFRLVVYNADGAFVEPCVIPVSVGGAP